MNSINHKVKDYKNYGQCLFVDNGTIELVVTLETGPRIIRYGFVGDVNEFCDDLPYDMKVGSKRWRIMGGHRLWHSPEEFPRSYYPDNDPVRWEKTKQGVIVQSSDGPWVNVDKKMEIILAVDGRVTIEHTITNKNAWEIEMAAWAISVMASGGTAIIPQSRNEKDFVPGDGAKGAQFLTLWAYTKMNDPRVYWGDRYITVKCDEQFTESFKIGISNENGWAAYLRDKHLFIKKFKHIKFEKYPDNGVSFEVYCDKLMLEMESLSPLKLLKPGEAIKHVEEWRLHRNVEQGLEYGKQIDTIKELIK